MAGDRSLLRALRIADLEALSEIVRSSHAPADLFAGLQSLTADVIGHRLFTIMQFDAERFEVERVHTSLPSVYPCGGRKQKAQTAWGEHVLEGCKVFRGMDAAAIRATFDDHETILGLGLGSILNIPICVTGHCIGTMNLCHQEGWFTADDERTGLLLGTFLVPALLHVQERARRTQRPIA